MEDLSDSRPSPECFVFWCGDESPALVNAGNDGILSLKTERTLTPTTMLIPTLCGNMTKVDSKGRIVLPQEVRERLGITPGTEVDVREEDGKAVVKPEDNPDKILEQMEQLVEEASSNREETTPLPEGADPIAQKHRDAVLRGAEDHCDE